MDATNLRILEAEIQAPLDKIEQVYLELEDRASQIVPDTPAHYCPMT